MFNGLDNNKYNNNRIRRLLGLWDENYVGHNLSQRGSENVVVRNNGDKIYIPYAFVTRLFIWGQISWGFYLHIHNLQLQKYIW